MNGYDKVTHKESLAIPAGGSGAERGTGAGLGWLQWGQFAALAPACAGVPGSGANPGARAFSVKCGRGPRASGDESNPGTSAHSTGRRTDSGAGLRRYSDGRHPTGSDCGTRG